MALAAVGGDDEGNVRDAAEMLEDGGGLVERLLAARQVGHDDVTVHSLRKHVPHEVEALLSGCPEHVELRQHLLVLHREFAEVHGYRGVVLGFGGLVGNPGLGGKHGNLGDRGDQCRLAGREVSGYDYLYRHYLKLAHAFRLGHRPLTAAMIRRSARTFGCDGGFSSEVSAGGFLEFVWRDPGASCTGAVPARSRSSCRARVLKPAFSTSGGSTSMVSAGDRGGSCCSSAACFSSKSVPPSRSQTVASTAGASVRGSGWSVSSACSDSNRGRRVSSGSADSGSLDRAVSSGSASGFPENDGSESPTGSCSCFLFSRSSSGSLWESPSNLHSSSSEPTGSTISSSASPSA